jgi:hypothetical protein
LEVFFFCVDEIASSVELTGLLQQLLEVPGTLHLKIAAYAIATRQGLIEDTIRQSFDRSQLEAALQDTPALSRSLT